MSTIYPPSTAKSRRHPGPLPTLMDSMQKIEQALRQSVPPEDYAAKVAPVVQGLRTAFHVQDQLNRRLWAAYNSLPAPHASTHLGGDDNLIAVIDPEPLTPASVGAPGVPQAGAAAIGHVHDMSGFGFLIPLEDMDVDPYTDQASVSDSRLQSLLAQILVELRLGLPELLQLLSSLQSQIAMVVGLLTTKGDLYGFGTAASRVPAGSPGFGLTSNPLSALGLDYEQYADLFLGLAASWRFNEAAAGPFYDWIGQNNLTAHGTLTSVAGQVGNAISIGAGGAMQCPFNSSFLVSGTQPFGFAVLLNPTGANPGWQEFVFGNADFAGPDVFDYYLTFNHAGLMIPEWRMSGPLGTDSQVWPSAITPGWHLVMCWFDGVNMWMQVDGAEPIQQPALTGGTNGLSNPLTFGALWNGAVSFSNQFAGAVDSSQFYVGDYLANANVRAMLWNGGLCREVFVPISGAMVAGL